MHIVVTADTHWHPKWRATLEHFVADMAALRPDCLVVAGDVGERLEGYRQMLRLLQTVHCPRLILVGNHDLWMRDGIDSETLWTKTLPDITREHGAIWLEDETWKRDGVAVCGTLGWYDYTGRDPSIPMTDEQYFRDKAAYMGDGEYMRWDRTDIEFANTLGEAFSARLAALDADPAVREILVVTHVPAFTEAIARRPGDIPWNLTNAYFYNLTLGQRITASRKVTRVISGHTHIGKTALLSGGGGPIDMRVIPADYGKPVCVTFEYP
jgi:3',5'-cyclic AMP phosphodiesterase CpdA